MTHKTGAKPGLEMERGGPLGVRLVKSKETELKPCLDAYKKWWKDDYAGVKDEFTQALTLLTYKAAWNRRSPEPEESRSGEGRQQDYNELHRMWKELSYQYMALKDINTRFRSGVKKVRDEAANNSVERYPFGFVPTKRQRAIGDCARRIHTYYARALTRILGGDKEEGAGVCHECGTDLGVEGAEHGKHCSLILDASKLEKKDAV